MVRESSLGQMEELIKEVTKMTKRTVMECSHGKFLICETCFNFLGPTT
jgi:hypothetical protein